MSPEEITAALTLHPESMVRKALTIIVDERVRSASIAAANQKLSDSERAHLCGQLDEAISLQHDLKIIFEGSKSQKESE